MNINFKKSLHAVSCFVFDVDGVLTNGSLLVMPGELMRVMNIRDGYAMHEAIQAGYRIAVISGGKSESVRARLNDLGVKDVFLGVDKKTVVLNEYMHTHRLEKENVLYMGDDLPDYEVMQLAGVPVCPYDSAPEIKSLSAYISHCKGGEGCARDVIEQVMRLHGRWPFAQK